MEYDIKDIKRIRTQLGLTQSELSKKADVSQSLIAKVESGLIDPGYSSVKRIFDTLEALRSVGEPTAKDIMQKQVITVNIDDAIKVAVDKMRKNAISQLPVLDSGQIVGLVTESDLLELISSISSGKHVSNISKVSEIMKDTPPIVSETAKAKVVVQLLKFYNIVVVSDKGRFKGVITKADVLNKMY
jgi:predicted transcriptional regulator